MLERPPTPALAPEGYTDNELGEERLRMGQHIRVLECKLDGLVAWILEKPAEPCQPADNQAPALPVGKNSPT